MSQDIARTTSNVTPFPGTNQFQRAEARFNSIFAKRQFARAFVFVWDEETFSFTDQCALSSAPHREELVKFAKSISDDVVAIGYPLVIEDGFHHPLIKRNENIPNNSVGSFIGAPVRDVSGKTVAVLCIIDSQTCTWTEGDTFTVMDFARQIGINWKADLSSEDTLEGGAKVRFSPRDPMSRTVAGS